MYACVCSVNVPLQEGITDASYETVFRPVIDKVMETYRPTGNNPATLSPSYLATL